MRSQQTRRALWAAICSPSTRRGEFGLRPPIHPQSRRIVRRGHSTRHGRCDRRGSPGAEGGRRERRRRHRAGRRTGKRGSPTEPPRSRLTHACHGHACHGSRGGGFQAVGETAPKPGSEQERATAVPSPQVNDVSCPGQSEFQTESGRWSIHDKREVRGSSGGRRDGLGWLSGGSPLMANAAGWRTAVGSPATS